MYARARARSRSRARAWARAWARVRRARARTRACCACRGCAVPRSVLIVDPTTNASDTSTLAGLSSEGSKWAGGVLARNGRIYGIPHNATSVLVIDPAAGSHHTRRQSMCVCGMDAGTMTTKMTGLGSGLKWWGGVLGPDGMIYCIPFQASSVLVIDPNTDTSKFIGKQNTPPSHSPHPSCT